MKNITNDYKNKIPIMGRQIDSKISYTIEGTTTELGKEQLNSVTPHYESSILKSAMKQLDIDSNVDIPLNTTLNYQFGVLVNNEYEYINYGNYVVYSSEKQEDTNSYRLVCYDKMLYSMVDYTKMNITYPITIRSYIQAICDTIGLNFKNANDEFANYDKEIQNELYFDADGKSLGYKFRDVLDELAQVTGSTICISEDDELEIRYTNDLINEEKEVEGNPITITDNEGETPLEIDLKGGTSQPTYTGKNISKITTNYINNSNNCTCTVDSDEIITLNGTPSARTDCNVWGTGGVQTITTEPNTAYTMSIIYLSGSATGNVGIYYQDSGHSWQGWNRENTISSNSYVTSTYSTEMNLSLRLIRMFQGVTYNNLKFKIQFTKTSTADYNYEPYVGKMPSPNPDYPQPVNNVTGRQKIDIVGKNYLDYSKIVKGRLDNGVIGYASDTTNLEYTDNSIIFTTIANWRGVTSDYIEVQPNTSYMYSADKNLSATTYQIEIDNYNKNKEFLYRATLTRVNNTATYTTNSNVKYIRIYFTLPSAGTYTINNAMLEKGSTQTTYEPYIGKQYEINLGKNLFDKDNANTLMAYINGNGKISQDTELGVIYIPCKPSTNYAIQKSLQSTTANNRFKVGCCNSIPAINTQLSKYVNLPSGTTETTMIFKTDSKANYLVFNYAGGTTSELEEILDSIQIEEGSQASSYSPYKTPIELCKIGNYQDYIRKSTGKNLFDKDNANILKGWLDNNKMALSPTQLNRLFYIPCKTNTTYTISRSILTGTFRVATYDSEPFPTIGSSEVQYDISGLIKDNSATSITITTGANAKYLIVHYGRLETDPNIEDSLKTIQIEEGSTATTYEPYGNIWYKCSKIGKVVLNGTETYSASTAGGNRRFQTTISDATTSTGRNMVYTNYFIYSSNTNNIGITFMTNGAVYLYPEATITTTSDFTTWLSTHNTEVYYILATPTNTEITDTELINQLEIIKLLNGLNQISLSSDGTLKLSYVSDYEYIDENYLKDINVNFGEKYGPVNSIVLSRSAGADNVYLRDEDSIAEDGLCEIKISDNQIMNFNDRDTYLPDLLKVLKGYSYYLNDFSSTGITFYELCDKYRVKIGDTKYPCIMYNDEVLVTQGLQENVHTDRPEESETDYSKADKTDRRINQTNLIVNKQTGQIEALTTKTEEIEEDLSENYYTKSMTNQLIQNAETGVTNTFSEAGGNNILRNTNFAAKEVLETDQEYEYWYGSVVKATNNNSANGMSILLQNGNLYQEQQVANGTYTVSFYYKKLNPLATGKLVVNGIEYALTEDDYTLFQTGLKDEVGAYITQPIIVNDNHLRVQFTSDTNNAFEVYDIMCNFGTVKLAYSQNQNETITNTVNISKGITITASDKDVKFVATPDGIRIKNKDTDEIITDFTDKGMDTKNAIIEETATIVGIYRQKVGDQIWDSLM